MNTIIILFGEGKDLNITQMCMRSLVVFIICFVLIRISGRRSFGLKTPLDNIIAILLGALLSRAIVGASPFLPVVCASLLFVLLHRALAWLMLRSEKLCHFIEGQRIVLFGEGQFISKNMDKALVTKEDIMQGVRKSALTENMSAIDKVYMERNGDVSPIKKHP